MSIWINTLMHTSSFKLFPGCWYNGRMCPIWEAKEGIWVRKKRITGTPMSLTLVLKHCISGLLLFLLFWERYQIRTLHTTVLLEGGNIRCTSPSQLKNSLFRHSTFPKKITTHRRAVLLGFLLIQHSCDYILPNLAKSLCSSTDINIECFKRGWAVLGGKAYQWPLARMARWRLYPNPVCLSGRWACYLHALLVRLPGVICLANVWNRKLDNMDHLI